MRHVLIYGKQPSYDKYKYKEDENMKISVIGSINMDQTVTAERIPLSKLIIRTARCEPLKKVYGLKKLMQHTVRMRLIWQ